jgi:class 3 adenylate cyclase/tetratricopeptide (TPR) repeat protein
VTSNAAATLYIRADRRPDAIVARALDLSPRRLTIGLPRPLGRGYGLAAAPGPLHDGGRSRGLRPLFIVNPLVPDFILQKESQSQTSSEFEAAALFVDIAGFTAVTTRLQQHGREGAEALAHTLRFYFDPLIKSVHEAGGFITGFAGDACTALFEDTRLRNAAEFALDAANRMQRFVAENPVHETRFGSFAFSLRVGLSWGKVQWEIVRINNDRSYFYFHGPAVEGCAAVEHHAESGQVLLDSAFRRRVPRAEATHVIGDVFREIKSSAPSQRLGAQWLPAGPEAARFLAPGIMSIPALGEFRDVVSVFALFHDATDLPALVRLLHELAQRYGGTFSGLDFGDKGTNVLIHFGAPVAHENDTERALDFALELRRLCPAPIRLCAGVTRDIRYVGFNGGTRRHEFACLGRATNLAARLMMKADAGEILCDPRVAADAGATYALKSRGDFTLKGFDDPVEAFTVGRKLQQSVQKEFSAKELVGREVELAALAAAVAPIFAAPPRPAGLIHIDGDAGLGKSYFVETFRRSLDRRAGPPLLWIEAPCDQTLQRSFNAFETALRVYFHQSAAAGREENHVRFDDALDRLLERLPASADALRRELDQARSLFAALAGIRREGSLYERLNPKDRFSRTLAAITSWIRAESLLGPVVIHLEDAQWADVDTQRAVQSIARLSAEGAPIAVLSSSRYRDDGSTSRIDLDRGVLRTEIALGPLSPEQIGQVADNAAGRRVPDIFRVLLLEHAGGNPFYTEEIVSYWADSGVQRELGDTTISSPSVALLPSDVNTILIARLDRLPPPVKTAVLAAAVLGKEFDARILTHMLDGRAEVAEQIRAAEVQRIWTSADGVVYRFRNTLLRNAAYEIQARARLQRLHFRAAEAIQVLHKEDLDGYFAVLARHYRRADAPDRARHYFLRAARQAANRWAHAEAKRMYRGYLKLVTSPTPESIIARYELARDVLEVAGEIARARDEHGQVIAEAQQLGDKSSEALGWLGLGRVRWATGELDEAEGCLAQAIAIARGANNRWTGSRVLAHLALVQKARGDTAGAITAFGEALRIGVEIGIRDESTVFGGIIQHYTTEGRVDEALALYEQAMDLRRDG